MQKLNITHDLMQHFKYMKLENQEQRQMQAFCDHNGKAFLSIGNNGKLYITSDENMRIPRKGNQESLLAHEIGSESGWLKKDISKDIILQTGSGSIVKYFSLGEALLDGKYVLCAVTNLMDKDSVFYSISESIVNPKWTKVNLPPEFEKLKISNVQIQESKNDIYINLQVKQQNDRLQQYFLRSKDGKFDQWEFTPFAADFDKINSTAMGHPDDSVKGSYVLGKIKNVNQLLFTPSYNKWDPGMATSPSRFQLPNKSGSGRYYVPDCLTTFTVPDSDGATDMYTCGDGMLSVYPYENQHDMVGALILVESEHFCGVNQIFACEAKDRVYIWILNKNKDLCYLYADLNDRYNPDAWSVVMILYNGLDYVHVFEDDGYSSFYGYTDNGDGKGKGILGSEDMLNGLWSYTNVFTSTVEDGKPVPIHAFITYIKAKKANSIICLKTKESGVFEINEKIYSLNKDESINIECDLMGCVNIIQLTELSYAIEFEITSGSFTSKVNPSTETENRLLSLRSVEKLKNAKIQTIDNPNSQPLIAEGTTDEELESVAKAIDNLYTQYQHLNGTNSVEESRGVHIRCHTNRIETIDSSESDITLLMNSLDDQKEYSSEDVFAYIRSQCSPHSKMQASNGWFDIFIKKVNNVCKFVVETVIEGIKKTIYFVIDTIKKVVCSVKEFLVLLVTDPKKILDFLKYLFDFKDILYTKDYMKSFINTKMDQFGVMIDDVQKTTNTALSDIEKKIAEWGGLDTSKLPTDSPTDTQAQHANKYSDGNVHTNYFTNLVSGNVKHVDVAFESSMIGKLESNSVLDDLFDKLKIFAETEGHAIQNVVKEIGEIIAPIKVNTQLDIGDIFKKLLAILGKGIVTAVKGFADLIFDLTKVLVLLVKDIINKDFEIPCVSDFLRSLGIGSISLLDVALFAPCFFATITYKLIAGEAPIKKEDLELQKNNNFFSLQDYVYETDEINKKKRQCFIDILTGSCAMFIGVFSFVKSLTVVKAITKILLVGVFLISLEPETMMLIFIGILYVAMIFPIILICQPNFEAIKLVLEPIFAIVSLVLDIVLLGKELVYYIKDSFPIKRLGLALEKIQSIISNLIDSAQLDITDQEAALALHGCELVLSTAASSITICSAAIELENYSIH